MDLPPELWPLLHRTLTGEGWPPSGDDAVDLLVSRSGRSGLLPLLFAADDLPESLARARRRHQMLSKLYRRRCEVLLVAVERLTDVLAPEPYLLLKGCDYMYRLYGDPVLRPMADIDVLVPADGMQAACHRIEQLATPRRPFGLASRLASYHERGFSLGGIHVDVHQAFLQAARHTIDYHAVLERRVALHTPRFRAWRLNDDDAITYSALTMAMDEFSSPLIRYLDLWLMLRSAPGLVERAAKRASEWGARRALYGALRLLERAFPDSVTHSRSTTEHLLPPATRRFLERFVLPRHVPSGLPSRPLRLWRKFWLIDTPGRRFRFALDHARSLVEGSWLALQERG